MRTRLFEETLKARRSSTSKAHRRGSALDAPESESAAGASAACGAAEFPGSQDSPEANTAATTTKIGTPTPKRIRSLLFMFAPLRGR
jgi:hypothetical protein